MKYITIYNAHSHGYQTIGRASINQTFYWRPLFPDMVYEFEFSLWLKSDLNYQLAVL